MLRSVSVVNKAEDGENPAGEETQWNESLVLRSLRHLSVYLEGV